MIRTRYVPKCEMDAGSEDPFWDAYDEEDRFVERGVESGIKHGQQLGWVEGWQLGVKQGYQVGFDVGFYAGSLKMLQYVQAHYPDSLPEKVTVLMKRLKSGIDNFVLQNSLERDIQAELNQLKELHKQIASLLNMPSRSNAVANTLDF